MLLNPPPSDVCSGDDDDDDVSTTNGMAMLVASSGGKLLKLTGKMPVSMITASASLLLADASLAEISAVRDESIIAVTGTPNV